MAHIINRSTKVGLLKIGDPRAGWARVELNGLDVTRGYGVNKYKILAAHDIEGWICYRTAERLTAFARGTVRITFAPSDETQAVQDGDTIPAASPKDPQ